MITKRIASRRDGRNSARAALRYGEGLKRDRESGVLINKSHRTRLANFGLVDDGVHRGNSPEVMANILDLAAAEMQSCCDKNSRVGADKKIAHFLFSFDQTEPSEAVLTDTEDSMLAALGLSHNHSVSFLHSDNGHWHLHLFVSRIDKVKSRGNDLWRDRIIRDRVARQIEARHKLARDNGLHGIDESGQIVEVPPVERERRKATRPIKSDNAQTIELNTGEKTFQTWCEEIQLGDRLKHARNWQELHSAAAAYRCTIRQRGAGFVVRPAEGKGSLQLSRIGLKSLTSKFGPFQPAKADKAHESYRACYTPSPVNPKAASEYERWREARHTYQPIKTAEIQRLREEHKAARSALRQEQAQELVQIRSSCPGERKFADISLAKMRHVVQLSVLAEQLKLERKVLYRDLAKNGPGSTFQEYLLREAAKGDELALQLVQGQGNRNATDVLRKRESKRLEAHAAISGQKIQLVPRLHITHHVESSGSVVYHLGGNRKVIDSALSRRVELNDVAAQDAEAIATALRFATLKFGPALTLTGSAEFQRLAVETAVRERLGIRFADPALQAYCEKLKAERRQAVDATSRRIEPLPSVEPTKPVVTAQDELSAPIPTDARNWAEKWGKENNKGIVLLCFGSGVAFTVLHVANDGIVLDLGRSIAVHPLRTAGATGIVVGSKVLVGRNEEVILQNPVGQEGKGTNER